MKFLNNIFLSLMLMQMLVLEFDALLVESECFCLMFIIYDVMIVLLCERSRS